MAEPETAVLRLQRAMFWRPTAVEICFDRLELDAVLTLYGRGIALAAWRDYAIDQMEDRAVFSIFRRAREMPLYRLEKKPVLLRRNGFYALVAAGGFIMKRGNDLTRVLEPLSTILERSS